MTKKFRIVVKYFGECVRRLVLNRSFSSLFTPLFCVLLLLLFCEFTIYYLTLLQCTWPELNGENTDPYIKLGDTKRPYRIMVLAGTYLLDNDTSRWFGPDRVFWQMERSFRAASFIHNPDIVIIVGNLLSEPADRLSDSEIKKKLALFNNLFMKQSSAEFFFILPGAGDLGDSIREISSSYSKLQYFLSSYSAQLYQLPGLNMVLLNSALFSASDNPSCRPCLQSGKQFDKIAHYLSCSRGDQLQSLPECIDEDPYKYIPKSSLSALPPDKRKVNYNLVYSRPILIQNLPPSATNRLSSICSSVNLFSKFTRRNLSQYQSEYIIQHLHPRLILSTGATNYKDCLYHTKFKNNEFVPTWILPRFGWSEDSNVNVGFLLIRIDGRDFSVNKCYLPKETTIFRIYCVGLFLIALWFVWPQIKRFYKKVRGKQASETE